MVSVPERDVADGFGCATKLTSPVPADPDDEMESHGSPAADVQPHAAGAITPTDPEPPPAGAVPVADCSV